MSSNSNRNGTFMGPKPTKACVNCRRQKMKCEVEDQSSTCKRCRLSQIPCIFKPRANAAAVVHELPPPSHAIAGHASNTAQPTLDPQTVLSRLDTIEALLGIVSSPRPVLDDDVCLRPTDADSAFHGVFAAAMHLKTTTRPPQTPKIWSRDVIKQLWLSFHKNMPGLHFLSKKKTSSTPTPLLLAAILYVSALHHQSPDFAGLAPGYFVATCSAISELAVPIQAASRASKDGPNQEKTKLSEEQRGFQNVLGLILAGLISEAFIETAGLWITMGYRLTLDHCPVHIDERSHEWRGLFSGLQIIDLEHASLHMSCPIVPKEAPLPSLRQLQTAAKDPFYSLTQMMHTGLSHFTGRGLPTIWSFISSNQVDSAQRTPAVFTEADSKVIREWARQLDDWLVQWNKPNDPDHDSLMIFRQYSLHRLFVLSIYHPARGFDLFANNVANMERHELLISARATLKLQNEDKGIWSNWDLVMITWAALLVLQGIEGGVGESDDFILIQTHLNMLQTTHQPEPSLRHTLASRLESSLQNMHTPRPAPELLSTSAQVYNNEWAIFDSNSILQFQNIGPGTGNGVGMSGFGAQQQFGDMDAQWLSGEQYSDAWQSTMFRIFGSGNENQEMGMEMGGNGMV
ncbi:uncharacterized protein LY89DRAFT_113348 [Mollisia scopiformis]|uniref:Zn(2)-C6 fungal-type domain-containing protein n=1 Tax=Mollisia scopiformis TaxID=149040 RepID=A0A194X5K8_MOLSC|nr:uncharacterized protein LY89DRAFT_113348 [Mollisia scopiformis]KUJ15456.1 hypothetical protein LY89DRAFT_113348 [Mollisia scopiformis]